MELEAEDIITTLTGNYTSVSVGSLNVLDSNCYLNDSLNEFFSTISTLPHLMKREWKTT